MIKVANVIANMKTDLTNASWTSDDGTGTTSFKGVFTFPNFSNQAGYPFAVILDTGSSAEVLSNKYFQNNMQIEISLCANWTVVDEPEDNARREEAMLRLREAWDYMKVHISKDATLNTWTGGNVEGWENTWNSLEADIPELNLYRRIITINLLEQIFKL